MRTGVLRNIAVAGVSALLLTACAGRDDAGVGTVQPDTAMCMARRYMRR